MRSGCRLCRAPSEGLESEDSYLGPDDRKIPHVLARRDIHPSWKFLPVAPRAIALFQFVLGHGLLVIRASDTPGSTQDCSD